MVTSVGGGAGVLSHSLNEKPSQHLILDLWNLHSNLGIPPRKKQLV